MKLLNEGNLKRYLIYAIGEILLVVIGILIAFQLSDWNDDRIERHKEKQHLTSIAEDLSNDVININKAILGNTKISNGLDSLLEMLTTQHPEKVQERMMFLYSIKYTYWYMTVEFSELTFQQLKSTGNFQLIKDKEVAKSILQYIHGIEKCSNEYTELVIYYHEQENTQKKLFNLSLAKEAYKYLTSDYMNMFTSIEHFGELANEGDYLSNSNPALINSYYGDILFYNSQLNFINSLLYEQKVMADKLIKLIEKKYR